MKFITFKKIQIKNFLSIGEEPVIIEFKPGVNFITGTNSDVPGTKNGVGKSSIVAAFSFAIFGKTLKDLAIRNIPNNLVKGLLAQLFLNLTVIRPREIIILRLFEN